MDLVSLLQEVQNPDSEIRNRAESTLRRFENDDYQDYVLKLCTVFNNAAYCVHIQRLAAILLKNTLQYKDHDTKLLMKQKWIRLEDSKRHAIHAELLHGLHNTEVDVCCTVSMVISTVAAIDLPQEKWTDLIPALLQNMEKMNAGVPLQKSTLESMGYLCEELTELPDFTLPSPIVDRMLTAITRAMTKEDSDHCIRISATRALHNALEFTEKNFGDDCERNYLMTVLGQVLICRASAELRGCGFECLTRICQIYYSHMTPYMDDLFKLTVEVIQHDEEGVVKQAMEVWSTICEEEIDLTNDSQKQPAQPDLVLHHFAKRAAPTLVPVLLDQLMKQEDDQECDQSEWTVAMAAGSCLALFSEAVRNDIVQIVVPFVQANIKKNEGSDDWRCREAATYAFGAILEGPEEKMLAPLVSSGLPFLLGALRDGDPHVRNTTAWTIGRVFQFVNSESLAPELLNNDNIKATVETLLEKIIQRDESCILERLCLAVEKLALCCEANAAVSMSPFFKTLIEELLKVAFIPMDPHSPCSLQVAAFDAINQLVKSSNQDALDLVVQLIPFLTQKLADSLHVQPADCTERALAMQGMICGTLSVVFLRLSSSEGHRIPLNQCSGQIFALLAEVLQASSADASVVEEAINTLGALVSAGVNFGTYVQVFVPYLERFLRNNGEKFAFMSCVGAVSDIFGSLGDAMEPYAHNILTILCDTLSNPAARSEIKPPILSLIGDICMALSNRFQKFLPVIKNILKQATEMAVIDAPEMDEGDTDYVNELMLGILEAYAGISQGLSAEIAGQFLAEENDTLVHFLSCVARDRTRNGEVSKHAVALLGDIVGRTPRFTPSLNQKGWMERFIQECAESSDEAIRKEAERTRLIYSCVCP